MTTTRQMIESVRDILAADTDVNAWCQANFGRGLTVYVGIDEAQPAPPEDYPLAALVDLRARAGNAANRRTWELLLGLGVIAETVSVTGNVHTYTGLLQAEELRDLAENALLKGLALPGVSARGVSARINMFPTFVSYTLVSIEEIASRRQARFR